MPLNVSLVHCPACGASSAVREGTLLGASACTNCSTPLLWFNADGETSTIEIATLTPDGQEAANSLLAGSSLESLKAVELVMELEELAS